MSSRSFRLETRSRARDEIKRIMQTVEKVRKWEKKWIDLGLSNSLKVYKWVPVRDENKDDDSDEENKENEPVELTETNVEQNSNGEGDLPDIKLSNTVPEPMGVDSSSLMASQAPPDMLLGSEEGEKSQSPREVVAGSSDDASGAAEQDTKQTEKEGKVDDGTKDVAMEEEQHTIVPPTECADEAKPKSVDDDTSGEAMETTTETATVETATTDTATEDTATKETTITDTETVATKTSGSNDGGNEIADGSPSVQQSSAPETSAAKAGDSSGVVTSQTVEQTSTAQAENNENQSAEGGGKVEGEPSESVTAMQEVTPEESGTGTTKEEGDGVSEKRESGASEETGDQQQVGDSEKRGEKRGCDEALEGNCSPPSPKRSRSRSPQTL